MSELNGTIHGIWTIVLMSTVIGIYAWAWSSKRDVAFNEAAMLAVDDSNNNPAKKEKS